MLTFVVVVDHKELHIYRKVLEANGYEYVDLGDPIPHCTALGVTNCRDPHKMREVLQMCADEFEAEDRKDI